MSAGRLQELRKALALADLPWNPGPRVLAVGVGLGMNQLPDHHLVASGRCQVQARCFFSSAGRVRTPLQQELHHAGVALLGGPRTRRDPSPLHPAASTCKEAL